MSSTFDTLVVGGGTAGCVIASRLSERAAHSVLLLEAGRDVVPGQEPADIADVYPASYFNKSYFWGGLKGHWRTRADSPLTGFSQARVLGGGGAVMGMVALRGTPADYDEWAALGADGWDWAGVLPYFRKLETDCDFAGEAHGRAAGVRALVGGVEREFRAREVVVTCGAIFTPALLLRSGIGPSGPLDAVGIKPLVERRGVGANLQNHPVLFIGMHLKKAARQPAALRTVPVVGLRWSSGLPGCPPSDLYVNVQSKTSWNALGQQIGNIAPTVLRPRSRGRVRLASADPRAPSGCLRSWA